MIEYERVWLVDISATKKTFISSVKDIIPSVIGDELLVPPPEHANDDHDDQINRPAGTEDVIYARRDSTLPDGWGADEFEAIFYRE